MLLNNKSDKDVFRHNTSTILGVRIEAKRILIWQWCWQLDIVLF